MWCRSLAFCVFFVTVFDFVITQYDSPCPDIFEYVRDDNGKLYGKVRIDNPRGNKVVLDVDLSVGNSVKDYGNIELAYKSTAVEEIASGRPLYYKVFFSYWRDFPPRITKIMVNEKLICSGPPFDIKRVPISLQHTVNLALTPDTAGAFDDNDNHHQSGVDSSNSYNNNIKEKLPLPYENGNGSFSQFGAASAVNHYSGNPFFSFSTTESPHNSITYYRDNPFLNISTGVQENSFPNVLPTTSTTTTRPFVQKKPEPTTRKPVNHYSGNPFFSFLITERPHNSISYYKNNPFFNNLTNAQENPFANVLPTTTSTTTTTTRPFVQKEPDPTIRKHVRPNLNNICGKSLSTTSLIAHGIPVAEGYYPWLVALYNIQQLIYTFTCGGCLVSEKHVITAAHCLRGYKNKVNIDNLRIILGEDDLKRWENDKDSLILSAETVNVHPDYQAWSADADIAVITLAQEVRFKSFIRPICLWSDSTNLKEIEGDIGVVAGWGMDENKQSFTPELKQVRLPIVSQAECHESHDNFADVTSERTFCAGYGNGSGPCKGDSGGGFMMKRNGRWTLRGVVSLSIADEMQNCDLSHYLVFTDVSKFTNWILAIINK